MNVILADRADDSDETESTNGLGKTTLLRIIHFCLGSDLGRDKVLTHPKLSGVTFGLSFLCDGQTIEVLRDIGDAKNVWVTSSFLHGFEYTVEETSDSSTKISLEDYRSLLTLRFIGNMRPESNTPSFREIALYLIRIGKSAFIEPTTAFQGQPGASKRISTSYLLGLNWSSQKKLQTLLDARRQVDAGAKALEEAEASSRQKSIGDLEAERVALEAGIGTRRAEVEKFNVRDDYQDLQDRLSQVDRTLHDLINENFGDKRLLQHYVKPPKNCPRLIRRSRLPFFKMLVQFFAKMRFGNWTRLQRSTPRSIGIARSFWMGR